MDENKTEPQSEDRARKPYAAPRIEESGRFEHLVLGCGHLTGAPECIFSENGERSD